VKAAPGGFELVTLDDEDWYMNMSTIRRRASKACSE
jgi:hypothetical protein